MKWSEITTLSLTMTTNIREVSVPRQHKTPCETSSCHLHFWVFIVLLLMKPKRALTISLGLCTCMQPGYKVILVVFHLNLKVAILK